MMNLNGAMRDALYARLHRPPSPHSVLGSLPVLFFGDIFSARIARWASIRPNRSISTDLDKC